MHHPTKITFQVVTYRYWDGQRIQDYMEEIETKTGGVDACHRCAELAEVEFQGVINAQDPR